MAPLTRGIFFFLETPLSTRFGVYGVQCWREWGVGQDRNSRTGEKALCQVRGQGVNGDGDCNGCSCLRSPTLQRVATKERAASVPK